MRKRRGGKRHIYTRAIYFVVVAVVAFAAGFVGWKLLGGEHKAVKIDEPKALRSEMTKEIMVMGIF